MKHARFALIPILFSTAALADTWTTGTSGQVTTSATATKVGIGTSGIPGEKLTVAGGGVLLDNGQYLKGKLSGASSGSNMVGITSGNQLNVGSANSTLGLSAGSATRLFIDASGNLGVGTTAPGSGRRLDVNGTARATAFEGDGGKLTNVAPAGAISVTQYGVVPNQTATDYAPQFQNALNAASGTGAGRVVFVPPGRYTLKKPLNIPDGVTLQGSQQGASDGRVWWGTVLLADFAGSAFTQPFITLQPNAALRGVTIHYPQQNSSTTFTDYPWTISGTFDAHIENVTLTNAFRGIRLTQNSHSVRNVNMTAFAAGVSVDNCLDISRLENVHIHPKYFIAAMGWTYPPDATSGVLAGIVGYTINHLIGFQFARSDWQEVSGCFVIWSYIGMRFVANYTAGVGGAFSGTIVNSAVDVSQYSVEVDATDGFGGVSFANTLLIGQAVISKSDLGPVRFTNCTFHPAFGAENPNRTTALVYHDAPSTVTITSSLFYDWDVPRAGHGCITLNQGTCLFSQNEFMPPGVPRPSSVPPPGPERLHFNLFNGSHLVASANRYGGPKKFFTNSGSTAAFFGDVQF